jgi:hypothetical protein
MDDKMATELMNGNMNWTDDNVRLQKKYSNLMEK